MYLTWLDNNSWLIEMGGQRILLDPWLAGPLVFGNLPWLIKGTKTVFHSAAEPIDLILLSQGLEDHAHPETLKQLDRTIPVVGSPNAAKVVEKLGYTKVTALAHGDRFTLADRITIEATPGAPIGPFLVENGYLLTDLAEGIKLYYEPHGYHSPTLQQAAPVDVVIAPLVTLALPVLGSIIQGEKTAPEVVEWLHPQVILPTAAGGDVVFEGLLPPLIQSKGSIEQFRNLLSQQQVSTQVISPEPGDRIELNLTATSS
jgi:L-ascorbate metabolism protein UlaG (beta-lactamase superfamily)